MLCRFRAAGFKSLQEIEVELGPLNVAFGPNGSGKSNFYEALFFLSEAVQRPSIHKSLAGIDRTDRLHIFRVPPGSSSEPDPSNEVDGKPTLEFEVAGLFEILDGDTIEYQVAVRYTPQTGDAGFASERLVHFVKEAGVRRTVLSAGVDEESGMHCSQSVGGDENSMETVSRTLPERTMASDGFLQDQPKSYPAVSLLAEETLDWSTLILDDMRSMREGAEPARVRSIGRHGENLAAFFHRLLNDDEPSSSKALAALLRSVRTFLPDVREFKSEVDPSTGRVALRTRLRDTWFSAGSLSDGTLRVVAICAEALNPYSRGLLIVEEPELGIHPQRIELVASLLQSAARHRQVFVSTHSPDLVGEFVRLARQVRGIQTNLLGFSRTEEGTKVFTMHPGDARLDDEEIRKDLGSNSASSTMRELLIRGWLNG